MGAPKSESLGAYHQRVLLITLVCVGWWILSTAMVIYNKWFFNNHCPETMETFGGRLTVADIKIECPGFGFPFPMFASACHMAMDFLFASTLIVSGFFDLPVISRRSFWRICMPLGVCTGLDIGLANLSYLYLEASFYEELKQTTLVITLFLSLLLGLQEPSFELIAIILLVAGGLGVAGAGEAHYNGVGVALVLASCVAGSIRGVIAQMMMQGLYTKLGGSGPQQQQRHPGEQEEDQAAQEEEEGAREGQHLDPVVLLFYQAPFACVTMLPFVLIHELPDIRVSRLATDPQFRLEALVVLVGGGTIGFFLTYTGYTVVRLTSALTSGVVKAIQTLLVIVFSVLVFNNPLTEKNVLGYVIAFVGIVLYNIYGYNIKLRKMREDELKTEWEDELSKHDKSRSRRKSLGDDALFGYQPSGRLGTNANNIPAQRSGDPNTIHGAWAREISAIKAIGAAVANTDISVLEEGPVVTGDNYAEYEYAAEDAEGPEHTERTPFLV